MAFEDETNVVENTPGRFSRTILTALRSSPGHNIGPPVTRTSRQASIAKERIEKRESECAGAVVSHKNPFEVTSVVHCPRAVEEIHRSELLCW